MQAVGSTSGVHAIVDAATLLFADHGFDAISVAAIAKRAGVCKASVFHHFPTKDDLYLTVIKQASAEHADYAESLLQSAESSAAKVRKLIYFEIFGMLDNQRRTRLLLREVTDHSRARVRRLARTVFQRNFTAVVNIFEQGRASGEFHAGMDPAAAAMVLSGVTQCYFNCREALREFREASGLEDPHAFADRAASLVLSGVLRPA